jgi:hypothetical protein
MSDDQEFSSSRRKFLGGAAVATGALATANWCMRRPRRPIR